MILPIGTPLWKAPAQVVAAAGGVAQRNVNTVAALPNGTSSPSSTHKILVGVTVRDGENTDLPMNVQESGVALARVRGEPGHTVASGDTLVQKTGKDYLVKQAAATSAPVAGTAEGTVSENEGEGVDSSDAAKKVKLIRVRLGQGGGVSASAELRQFRYESLQTDFLLARTAQDSIEKVALPYELRKTPWHNKTIGGVLYYYVSTTRRHLIRTTPLPKLVEYQIIIPRYGVNLNSLIYAVKVPETDVLDEAGEPVTWLELDQGRAWAQTFKSSDLDGLDPNL